MVKFQPQTALNFNLNVPTHKWTHAFHKHSPISLIVQEFILNSLDSTSSPYLKEFQKAENLRKAKRFKNFN